LLKFDGGLKSNYLFKPVYYYKIFW